MMLLCVADRESVNEKTRRNERRMLSLCLCFFSSSHSRLLLSFLLSFPSLLLLLLMLLRRAREESALLLLLLPLCDSIESLGREELEATHRFELEVHSLSASSEEQNEEKAVTSGGPGDGAGTRMLSVVETREQGLLLLLTPSGRKISESPRCDSSPSLLTSDHADDNHTFASLSSPTAK